MGIRGRPGSNHRGGLPYVVTGTSCPAAGKFTDAVDLYSKVQEKDANLISALNDRGLSNLQLNAPNAAFADFTPAAFCHSHRTGTGRRCRGPGACITSRRPSDKRSEAVFCLCKKVWWPAFSSSGVAELGGAELSNS